VGNIMSVEEIKKYLSDQFHLPLEQVETMMPSFISTLGSHMETLEEALDVNDPSEIGKAGHTIKGAFLNLGLAECARIALDIEESGKAGNGNADYRSKVDSLHRCLEPVFK
jgi:HPt (histidine-containing phosphotransfer) domain-containing protein